MDIVTTSLDALLLRATNHQNENVDKAAVEAFCALVSKENEGPHIAVRLIANRIHAHHEKEALQALGVLDACMKKCGTAFHSEVGKFRFLNEMIKLVSPKYLGSTTPPLVRVKVLHLLHAWTQDYPRETKIKEAYDMLKKQGVAPEAVQVQTIPDNSAPRPTKNTNSIFDNDERSRLLQKLLQSKNPDDLQAANRLIKTMVKEDDRRAELVSKRVVELEAVHNNVKLLNEMLDSYRPGQSSADELDLIKELYQSCERLRPNVYRLAAETQQNEEMLKEVLQASDDLSRVFDKYTAIIVRGVIPPRRVTDEDSLLDLCSPQISEVSLLEDLNINKNKMEPEKPQTDIDALCDIFSSTSLPAPMKLPDVNILKPTTTFQKTSNSGNGLNTEDSEKVNNKLKALDDLDVLGETLLKENLSGNSSRIGTTFNKTDKIPMNLLTKQTQESVKQVLPVQSVPVTESVSEIDLSFSPAQNEQQSSPMSDILNGDDCMVDITENITKPEIKPETPVINKPQECKPLNEISIKLENIKPSTIPPLTVLEEKNGISVVLHFAQDRPRDDVQVVVVTTLSKNKMPLTNYLFQAVVPKSCKLKLQPPSGSELPAHNPFLPPSAITQIMLIANPNKENISLKFMISYTMEDETCTEMGEVECLPIVLS